MKAIPLKYWAVLPTVVLAILATVAFRRPLLETDVVQHLRGRATIADRVREHRNTSGVQVAGKFSKADVSYPPHEMILVGFKDEKRLEVYAKDAAGPFKFITKYPILAASGLPGPKLRYGDNQVPEGLYKIESLNPNSTFHLALRLNYPNQFDRERAVQDKRTGLGGNIMIHGNRVSIGCLAMGDEVAEELFISVADTGISNCRVILSPIDFRRRSLASYAHLLQKQPAWSSRLYTDIRKELNKLPPPELSARTKDTV
jgi:murein L,D-transpeptidase YafK